MMRYTHTSKEAFRGVHGKRVGGTVGGCYHFTDDIIHWGRTDNHVAANWYNIGDEFAWGELVMGRNQLVPSKQLLQSPHASRL